MANAYLGIGGNVGNARSFIEAAIEKLGTLGTVRAVSSLYRTEPVGFSDQPWFLNCVLSLETELPPEALLLELKRIEKEIGRTPSQINGPREIDIDILLYGDTVLKTETLTIPHPRMHERAFVLKPLSEIAPDAMHPALKKTVRGLVSALKDSHACEKLPAETLFPSAFKA